MASTRLYVVQPLTNDGKYTASAIRILQDDLDQKLVTTLAQLTGQSIAQTQSFTKQQMQMVIQASKDWATQHGLPASQ